MITIRLDLTTYIESILGTILYLLGIAGSYYRFGKFERKGKLDAIFLACVPWGGALLILSMLNIVKYNLLPTLHSDVVRVFYYIGTFVSSSVFFVKSFEAGKRSCLLATFFLWGTMAFIVAEGLVFYLDISYGAAIFSCIGLLMIFYFKIPEQLNLVGMLTGAAILFMPLLPNLLENGLDINKMDAKRALAIQNLLQNEKGSSWQENSYIAEMNNFQVISENDQL